MEQRKFTVANFKAKRSKKRESYLKNGHKMKPNFLTKTKFFLFKSTDTENFKSCSIKFKYTDEKIESAKTEVKKQKSNKKIWNIVMLLVNVGIIAAIFLYQNQQGTTKSLIELFNEGAKWQWLALAVVFTLVLFFVDSVKYYQLIYKTTKRFRPFLSFKIMAIGTYYDAVTPLGSGGQPFQIYYLNKRGIKGDAATTIPIARYVFFVIAFVILAVISLALSAGNIFSENIFLVTLSWITIAAYILIIALVVMLSVSKRIGPKIVIWCLKLLSKMKIVKNYKSAFRKTMRFVNNYQNNIKSICKSFWTMFTQIALAVISIVITGVIVYCIYRCFAINPNFTIIDILSRVIVIQLTSSLMPMPGGSGAAEIIFMLMFGTAISAEALFWAMLIYRFLTYYIYLIQGLIVIVYDTIVGNRKAEKLNKAGYFLDDKKRT